MGYALFANRKLMLTSQLNGLELQLAQRSTEQYNLAANTQNLQTIMSSVQSSQNNQLKPLYDQLVAAGQNIDIKNDPDGAAKAQLERENIQAQIEVMQAAFETEINAIQRQIDEVAMKENILEMAKQNLETRITAVTQELESVKEAEGAAIKRATPKYAGLG